LQTINSSNSSPDAYFYELKNAGATIKFLDASTVLAIFKNAAAAKKALESWGSGVLSTSNSDTSNGNSNEEIFTLKPWLPSFTNNGVSAPAVPIVANVEGREVGSGESASSFETG